jgi:dephospho-CoA kinase
MIRIAVVGNIGSGKSFVAKSFGLPVFDADKEVSLIYKKNKFLFKKLNKKIPKFIKTFPINKKEILSCILANNKNLKTITKIIHPIVRKKMNLFIKENKKKRAILLDIPLYLENRLNKKGDVIIYVDAHQKHIDQRLRKRPNYNKKLIYKFKKIQLKSNLKKKKSKYKIVNNFNSLALKKAVNNLKFKILKRNG